MATKTVKNKVQKGKVAQQYKKIFEGARQSDNVIPSPLKTTKTTKYKGGK
ncbi:hypothetical protein [Clostridium lacusfryxellense]|nr:hypothetical protein [Clostridium lacusfryxellense]MBU3110307.1 hypothetical protein [Clostridium lacusfryxellense]